jgi:1,4-dihydroxy-2-naphthoate octaprenyltransferase
MTGISNTSMDFQKTIKAWLMMARIPFHSVGVLPFCLGAVLAWRVTGNFNWPVFLWGTLAVVLIMLATYLSGEYYDIGEDRLSSRMERNPFTGGSQALVQGMVPRHHPKVGSYVALILAGIIGLLLQLYYKTGPWTIPLGFMGMVAGFFYSTEPIRWVKRGIGEFIIGFSYGWLPIAASFYLQTAHLAPLVHLMSLPIALSVFNVILINEFPDYPADLMEGKKTLTVRFGKKSASYIYAAACLGGVVLYPLSLLAGLSPYSILLYLPIMALSIMVTGGMLRQWYTDRAALEKMCGITIVINWLYAATYMLGIWIWGI